MAGGSAPAIRLAQLVVPGTLLWMNEFTLKGKKAEQMLTELATRTFLTDWCYPNPQLGPGREFCDLLVAFDDVVIIWAVKDLKLAKDGQPKPQDVAKNLRQLCGAKRQLLQVRRPLSLSNPRRGPEVLDPANVGRIYLVSALLGDHGDFMSLMEKDPTDHHPIHSFTREFTEIALSELNTISDFVDYLEKKEWWLSSSNRVVVTGGEEEVLGWFLMNSRSFDKFKDVDHIFLEGGIWEDYSGRPEVAAKKRADEVSRVWDDMIDRAHESEVPEYEIVARELARPNRFERRVLSEGFLQGLRRAAAAPQVIGRRFVPTGGMTYCFIYMDDSDRQFRQAYLAAACYIARGKLGNPRVIGVATEKTIGHGRSYDYCLFEMPEWTADTQAECERLQRETGILTNFEATRFQADEYPGA